MPQEPPVTPQTPPTTPTPPPQPTTPPSPPAPPTTPVPEPSGDNPFEEIARRADAKIKEMDASTVKPAPEKPLKAEPKTPEPKPQPKQPEKAKSEPHKLRDELDARTAELTTLKDSHTKLESKLKELEAKGQDTENVLKRIAQVEQERDAIIKEKEEFAAKLRVIRIEDDPEFQKKYDQPFNRLFDSTRELVGQIDVLGVGQDSEGNQVAVPVRKATERDLANLYYQYKDTPLVAMENAEKLFGARAAQFLIPKIENLVQIDKDRTAALNESRAKAAQIKEQEEARAATKKQQDNVLWVSVNKDLQERDPNFAIPPTDTELTQAKDEALRIFDGKPANEQQKLVKMAYIRQMVGQHYPNRIIIARLNKKVADQAAELESLKNPTPQPPKRPGGTAPTTAPEEDWGTVAKRELSGV